LTDCFEKEKGREMRRKGGQDDGDCYFKNRHFDGVKSGED